MSTSDLYILNQKSVTHYAEFPNGWGSGPVVWEFIGNKYIENKPQYWEMNLSVLKEIWALAGSDKLEEDERIAMMLTFDKAFVPASHFKQAGHACIKFYDRSRTDERVNHWAAIGDALIGLSEQKLSRYARGACLSCTSVNDIWCGANAEHLASAWPIFDEVQV